ncbi:hypothetical protein GGQ73_002374 [Rhizobium skierniewicense]|uniref:Uncharacterized protein n=1 Tax=Rhizobium skierniewicense TaxID=984260 RepID=A0A7W6C823_9HYPH|nr:hypothetical protein [Rhizobium skierniewicense]
MRGTSYLHGLTKDDFVHVDVSNQDRVPALYQSVMS